MQKPVSSNIESPVTQPLAAAVDSGVADDVLSQLPAILWTMDAEWRFTSSRGRALAGLGLQQNEVVGRTLFEFLGTDEANHPAILAHRQALAGEMVRMEDHFGQRDYDVTVSPLRTTAGEVTGVIGLALDITLRRRMERAFRDTERELLGMTVGSPDYVLEIDSEGRIHDVNRTFPQLSKEDVIGRRIYDWIDESDIEKTRDLVRACFETGQVHREEFAVYDPDGKRLLFDSRLGPIRVDGQIVGAVLMCFDLTGQREIEADLRRSEERFRLLAENMPGVVYLCRNDETYSMLYLNDPVEEVTGYAKEDFLSGEVSFVDLFHPDDAAEIERRVDQAIAEHSAFHLNYRIRHKSGQYRWIEERGVALNPEQDSSLLVGYLADVTEQRRAREELQTGYEALQRDLAASESMMQDIVDNTTAVVYMKDLEGRYLLVNRQFLDLFHLKLDNVIGKTDLDVFDEEFAIKFRKNDREVIEAGIPLKFDEVAPHDDGPHNYISIKLPLRDATGKIYAMCGISTDITERIRAEAATKNEQVLLRKLLAVQEQERRLIAYEIHDGLIQDVVGAQMMIERVHEKEVPADGNGQHGEGDERADQLEAARGLLAGAIDEGRRLISQLRPLILDEQGVIESISYLVEEGRKEGFNVEFEHRTEFDRLPALLEGTIYRIVQEALTNVRRHSHATNVQVRLTQHDDRLRLEIIDDGRGFDRAAVPTDRFGIRGIRERARLFGGTGAVESTPGQGTHVWVELPISVLEESPGVS
ncbi:MAG: PAS domain S-box protein [Planctomycetota bacterium]|nr:MAG: PAS domain S-box protein [Planctomycetota bacterium]REK44766.1 MAG: PAS domain S-box protein [Planctomycetota bacterium]